MSGPDRPHPGLMPKKRAAVPTAPARPAAAPASRLYAVDPSIPRRGIPGSVGWADTSVLLSLHARPPAEPVAEADVDVPAAFQALYAGRLRLAERVCKELRGISNGTPGGSDREVDLRDAASAAVLRLLVGEGALLPQRPELADLPEIEKVASQLRALPSANNKPGSHAGEAEVIVLASKATRPSGPRQVLLANDAGASRVALLHGLPSRHAGNVLAELACAGRELTPALCLRRFYVGNRVSGVPRSCAPTGTEAFTCIRPDGDDCSACD